MVVSQHMSVPPITIRTDADYQSALALMQEHAVHHVPVLDRDGALAGIVAERDLLLAASRYLQAHVDVGDIMHRDVVTVTPDTPLQQAAALLARHKIGGLPVVADGHVVGVITETDLLVALVDALETQTVALRPPRKGTQRARRAVTKVALKPLRRPR